MTASHHRRTASPAPRVLTPRIKVTPDRFGVIVRALRQVGLEEYQESARFLADAWCGARGCPCCRMARQGGDPGRAFRPAGHADRTPAQRPASHGSDALVAGHRRVRRAGVRVLPISLVPVFRACPFPRPSHRSPPRQGSPPEPSRRRTCRRVGRPGDHCRRWRRRLLPSSGNATPQASSVRLRDCQVPWLRDRPKHVQTRPFSKAG